MGAVMSTKGTIKKVVRREGVVFTFPRYFIIDEFKDEPQAVKLYIFRGKFSRRVNDVELPIWFA